MSDLFYIGYSKLTLSELLTRRKNLIEELDILHKYLFEHYGWRSSDGL